MDVLRDHLNFRTTPVRLIGTVSVLLLLLAGVALQRSGAPLAAADGPHVAEISGIVERANGDTVVVSVLVDTRLADPKEALRALSPEAEFDVPQPGDVTGAFARWLTWPAAAIPLTVRYNGTGAPDGVVAAGLVASAMGTWNAVSGHSWQFNYAGTTTAATDVCDETGESDGEVTVGWRNDLPLGILARTCALIRPSPSGKVPVEMDIGFSSKVPWSTAESTPQAGFDLQSTLLHELGDVIGLEHSGFSGAVMLSQISSGTQRRTLTADDIAGIRSLYPAPLTPPVTPPVNLSNSVRIAALVRD